MHTYDICVSMRVCKCVRVSVRRWECGCCCVCVCVGSSTLHGLQLVCLDDDAQLQDQLGGALQEGGQQVQHADV